MKDEYILTTESAARPSRNGTSDKRLLSAIDLLPWIHRLNLPLALAEEQS
jgi:hypothetical protein